MKGVWWGIFVGGVVMSIYQLRNVGLNHIIKTGRIISRKSDRDTGLSLEHYFNISMAGEGSVNPSSPLYFSYDL